MQVKLRGTKGLLQHELLAKHLWTNHVPFITSFQSQLYAFQYLYIDYTWLLTVTLRQLSLMREIHLNSVGESYF